MAALSVSVSSGTAAAGSRRLPLRLTLTAEPMASRAPTSHAAGSKAERASPAYGVNTPRSPGNATP